MIKGAGRFATHRRASSTMNPIRICICSFSFSSVW